MTFKRIPKSLYRQMNSLFYTQTGAKDK